VRLKIQKALQIYGCMPNESNSGHKEIRTNRKINPAHKATKTLERPTFRTLTGQVFTLNAG
jgi:hypothetical protein